jgi:hypothetical protein
MTYSPTAEERALFPNMTDDDFFRCVASKACAPNSNTCQEGLCFDAGGGMHSCLPIFEQCTPENNYGGCYVSSSLTDSSGQPLSACVSRISELRARAASGDAAVKNLPARNCSCDALPCHTGNAQSTECTALCGLEECLNRDNPSISACVKAAKSSALLHCVAGQC